MKLSLFKYKHAQLHYGKAGEGKKTILAFHGFGQDHTVFSRLADLYHTEITLYSFDLFFHGKSKWEQGEQPLEKIFWNELLKAFLNEHRIDRFSLLGYSMGGKFVLTALESLSDRVEEITLLAPDGIKTSFWYSLATYPVALRNLFRSMINKPQRFHRLAHAAFTIGLIDKGILRFVEHQMNSLDKRERVYQSWVVFRHLRTDLDTIARLIKHHKIPLTLVIGKHDKIITAHNMKHLTRKIPHHAFLELDCGHNALIHRWIEYLTTASEKAVN